MINILRRNDKLYSLLATGIAIWLDLSFQVWVIAFPLGNSFMVVDGINGWLCLPGN